jgi:hypothetical protein
MALEEITSEEYMVPNKISVDECAKDPKVKLIQDNLRAKMEAKGWVDKAGVSKLNDLRIDSYVREENGKFYFGYKAYRTAAENK